MKSAPWLLCVSLLVSVSAQTPVRLVRQADPSPDGQKIAFSWRGDIWCASSLGGDIRQLTNHPAQDGSPRWSPDGRHIAFVSDRSGSRQVWVMEGWGGTPRQVTRHTDGFALEEWTPDGSGFLVSATRDHWWYDAQRFFFQDLNGEEAPRLLFNDYGSDGSLSPDGTKLLFVREGTQTDRKRYSGSQASQVWVWNATDGSFAQLHGDTKGSRWPMFDRDGLNYWYVHQEEGAWNLYRTGFNQDGLTAGTSFRDDGVMFPRIARDGSVIIFSRLFDLYRLDTASGKVSVIPLTYPGDAAPEGLARERIDRAGDTDFSGDGHEMAFEAGGDIWVMDTELREPRRVTNTPEEESDPAFAKDGKTLYFISGSEGQVDVWRAKPKQDEQPFWLNEEFQLERVTNDPDVENNLTVFDDGRQLAYNKGTNVAVYDLDSGSERLVVESFESPSFDISPDGKWIAYATDDADYNSDVWVKPLDGSKPAFNISVHPDNDQSPKWSADGTMLAFTGRRWGNEVDIVYVNLRRPDDEETERQRRLKTAMEKVEKRNKGSKKGEPAKASSPEKPAGQPVEAIDDLSGKWKGFVTGDGIPGNGIPITFTVSVAEDGSITGRFVSPMGSGDVISGHFDRATKKLSLRVDADGEAIDIEGTVNGSEAEGNWNGGGRTGSWTADREGAPNPPAPSKAPSSPSASGTKDDGKKDEAVSVVIDFDGIHDRLRRIRLPDSSEGGLVWSPKGKKLYFRGRVGTDSGTFSVEFPDKLTPKKFAGSLGNGRWLDDGKSFATNSGGKPALVTDSGQTTTYAFTIDLERDVRSHHKAAFDEAWRIMRDSFYDERLGNNDWNAIRSKYIEMAAQCDSRAELNQVVNMMLGELNGSHLGFRASTPGREQEPWRPVTGHLGARFDADHRGPGWLVSDVVKGTPADRVDSQLHPGDVILTIDGQEVNPKTDPAAVLTGHPDREVILEVRGGDQTTRTVRLRPTTASTVRRQLYEAWIDKNRAEVDRLSDGRLGYLHIQSMGAPNLERFDEELYKVGHGKQGLVIDVRENGGGSITDHLLTCLCQPHHAITRTRTSGEGYPQDRRIYATWNRPIVVLCNQNSFSNAEIFSHAIKTLKRGQVVGVPTAGGVISTGSARVMDVGTIRTPGRGWYLLDGEDMELNGCVPHHVLWPNPGEIPAGKDRQLEKAVSVLLEDVKAYESRPRPTLKKASERENG